MKLKIQILEGFHTTIWRKPIEIDTDNYPELSGKTEKEVVEYLNRKSSYTPFYDGDDTSEDWTLFDELINQDKDASKEKNYETDILLVD